MDKMPLTYSKAVAVVSAVMEAITASQEWKERLHDLTALDFMDAREPFRRFFDAYDGSACEAWLGIMGWAVIEELRSPMFFSTAKTTTVDAIVSQMERHPDVNLEC